MLRKNNFLERFRERTEAMDANSRQNYILRLIRERGFFESALDHVEEGILLIDRSLHIRYHNRAAQELLALPENLSEVRVAQLLRDVDWEKLTSECDVWSHVISQDLEIFYPKRRCLKFCLVPMDDDPEIAGIILQDVTAANDRAVDALNHEAGYAVSLLAASVAHEIGNPLNSLYLNLQLLERAANGKGAPLSANESAEMVSSCKSEVERLDRIITQFLAAIRPGKGEFAPVNLRDTVLETLTFMRREIESRGIELSCDLPENLPNVPGDAAQLKQAFYNIIRNALQATPSGGKLVISAAFDLETLVLNFADSGSGIAANQINRIFQPFTTFKADGNGLGMMIIERICREHGIELGVDSSPDDGTVISLRFRLRPRVKLALEQ